MKSKNSFKSFKKLEVGKNSYSIYSLAEAEKNGLEGISRLPKSLKVLLENLLRYEDDLTVKKDQIDAIKSWLKTKKSEKEIAYRPARVLLQDYTGHSCNSRFVSNERGGKRKRKGSKKN